MNIGSSVSLVTYFTPRNFIVIKVCATVEINQYGRNSNIFTVTFPLTINSKSLDSVKTIGFG